MQGTANSWSNSKTSGVIWLGQTESCIEHPVSLTLIPLEPAECKCTAHTHGFAKGVHISLTTSRLHTTRRDVHSFYKAICMLRILYPSSMLLHGMRACMHNQLG